MLKVDLHTHTIKSKCGLSTLNENIDEAVKKNMKILGISDHGPKLGVSKTYFAMGDRIPKYVKGVRILFGAELNIINDNGDLDLHESMVKKLDYVIAGLHYIGNDLSDGDYNTEAVINAMKNPYVKIISHPTYFGKVRLDIKKVSEAACIQGKLLELNCSHYSNPAKLKNTSIPATQEMIKIIQQNNHKLIINSDAHMAYEIGDDTELMKYQPTLGFRDEDIINNDMVALKEYFDI